MSDEMRRFFMSLKNPNFLAMKLLLDVFSKMKNLDETSKKIVDNIDVFSKYNIKLMDSNSLYSSVYTEDDLSEIKFKISISAQEYKACHEFGHLLLDLFSDKKLPDNYLEINRRIISNVMSKSENICNMLVNFTNYLYEFGVFESFSESQELVEAKADAVKEYFGLDSDATEDELLGEVIIGNFIFFSNFDEQANKFNEVGVVLDSIFHGENPFYELYGNESFSPLLASHDKEYYVEDENGKYFAGFEEQFAEYLVLRVYKDDLGEVVSTLRSVVGDEWFDMMDKYYVGLADRVQEKNKVYELKA